MIVGTPEVEIAGLRHEVEQVGERIAAAIKDSRPDTEGIFDALVEIGDTLRRIADAAERPALALSPEQYLEVRRIAAEAASDA